MTDATITAEQRVTFGENLRRLRRAAGLTGDQLADRALGAKSGRQISRLENAAHVPRPATIAKLARALGVAPSALWPDAIDSAPVPFCADLVAAERERCAGIAEQYGADHQVPAEPGSASEIVRRARVNAAAEIASRIRQ